MDNNKQTPTRAEYNRKRRAERTPEQVEAENEIRRKKRAERTPAQKEAEAEQRRKKVDASTEQQRRRRANRTPEQIEAENEQRRQGREERTPEQIEAENEQQRLRRATRTPEQIESDRENEHQGWIRRNTSEFRDQVATRRRKKPLPSPYAARNPDNRPATHYLGRRNMPCQFCGALHFDAEKNYRGQFSSCCAAGSIQLPSRTDYPAKFQSWLTETSEEAKHVKLNIRKYNSAFAFASFGCQPVKFRSGLPVFAIHGQVYHRTAKSASGSENPTYAQLYILDPEFANLQRAANEHNAGCKFEVFEEIEQVLRAINPFVHVFKMMRDVINNQPEGSNIVMWITKDRKSDPRRYNLPTASEVAAVFVSDDGEPPYNRDIAVHPKGDGHLQNISIISPNCDPLTYPLLFPNGELGWQPNMEKAGSSAVQNFEDEDEEETKSRNLSMLEFYSYHLQERQTFNPLLHAGKLTQQFIIDAFLKVEGQRLQWNRLNQQKLRVDLYMGLMDYVNNQAQRRDLKAGRMVILPSSFHGGKRCMQQNYQDAMVLVAKFGKPDLFITFTCNPKWEEITSELKYGESTTDRPELVATVFKEKLKDFMNDMVCEKGGVLGKVKAYLSVIEFQKRGLPHCHMLFILEDGDKLREPEEVDNVVCAEIPDESDDVLYDIVKTCMLHGPCGENNQSAPCMAEEKGCKKCTKNFPKSFCDVTDANVDGYPTYRRRNNGKTVTVRNSELDNRWVVPYNPFLSRKYKAHINVEVCSSVKSVKYIFKYIYKGHDAAVVQVNEADETGTYNWDEIQTFLDTRYISAPEAMWRIRKYDMQGRSHAVERLPVHLPWQQTVVFEEGSEEKQLQQAEEKGTKLTKWFILNQEDPDARQYLYNEIPYHYVWAKNKWKKRQRGANKILPRMYTVSPKDMERYALRLLLMHIPGAESYEELRTINGVFYDTFFEAAKSLNLLDDDEVWNKSMEEANIFRMPAELRHLFATILIHASPSDPKALYELHKVEMYEDYLLTHSEYMAEQMALKDIEDQLCQFGKRCSDFGLPSPKDAYEHEVGVDIEKERQEAKSMVDMMNVEQRKAYNTIMNAVHGKSARKCYFLSGAGGCGKTFVYKALTSAILAEGGAVKCVAPTGLAATLLKGGRTVHSGFGICINVDKNTVSRFKQGSPEWKELLNTKLIIWDEISMCHVHLFLAVDRSLRDLLNCDEPFGGIPIVVGGDFRQQAPVVRHGNQVKIVEACVKSCSLWKKFTELQLIKNMRVNAGEEQFAEWLLSVGSGYDGENKSDFVKLDPEFLCKDIVTAVFGDDVGSLKPEELAVRAVLCPKNEDTMRVNETILSKLPGESTCYYSVDSIVDCESAEERAQYPLEFLNSLTPMGMPPHRLNLKKGCCVMLLRNLNTKRGLCNGTRLIVESLCTNVIECSIFSGARRGEKVFLPRINLDVKDSDLPFQLKRRQFPLRLAYSMTITKSQGQTFDRIGINLPDPVFTHGQLYTALSRVRSKKGLFIEMKEGSSQGAIYDNNPDKYTFNCIFRKILE